MEAEEQVYKTRRLLPPPPSVWNIWTQGNPLIQVGWDCEGRSRDGGWGFGGSEELAGEVGGWVGVAAAASKSGEGNKLPGARSSMWHPVM